MNSLKIKEIVKRLVKIHGTNDPFRIANYLDYIIVYCDLEPPTKGFYQYVKRNNIIYIDNGLNEFEQKMVCGHELAHAFLHKDTNAVFLDTRTFLNKSKFEIQANLFNAELLIRENLSEYEGWTCEQIACELCLSPYLIQLKYNNL
ncbi:MAG: ImmA/IrrE family metallo-endopeptidase [Acidaminococcaceae bacterium]